MRKLMVLMTVVCCILCARVSRTFARQRDPRRLPVAEYVDKMKAGWIGQMAGVGWGGPTEFKWAGQIIPEDKMPQWEPKMINQFQQDDIYVEMTFLRTLELYGLDVSIRQAGIDFANSGYHLWHANDYGRTNLRDGIAPPDSGHPRFHKHADDIDYQIEADYAGLISPGLPNSGIRLGELFGRLMNYGDGVYGGQFVAGMYAEAFFEKDMEKIVRAGLKCVPKGSQYHECIRDVLRWYKRNPNDWQKTWQLIESKYNDNIDYRRFACGGHPPAYINVDGYQMNIDAKINGAYIVMGLLYGKRDPDQTIIISTRCGQDSDCNPSNAGGVLFTTIGFSNLPDKFTSAVHHERKFTHTPYAVPTLVAVCEKLARESVKRAGGHIETDEHGDDVFVIPVKRPRPSKLVQSWEPGPIANSRFTEAEMEEIRPPHISELNRLMKTFAPGWKISKCGMSLNPGLRDELYGKKNVLLTHAWSEETGCVLSRIAKIPEGKKTSLRLVVGHHPKGDCVLIVRADGKELLRRDMNKETCENIWADVDVDLTDYAGKTVKLELVNEPNGWAYEVILWARVQIVSE